MKSRSYRIANLVEERVPDRQQILLVDDAVIFCNMLAEALESDGLFTVTRAYTIAEAQEKQAGHDTGFDILIVD